METNAWAGYLIAYADPQSTTTTVAFPHGYIKADSYSVNPDQREEIKAYRDDYTRDLTRITASGMKTKITFTIRPMNLNEAYTIEKWFQDHESSRTERKIYLKYWDDETFQYKFGYFYRTNHEHKINYITDTDIQYGETEISLTEY